MKRSEVNAIFAWGMVEGVLVGYAIAAFVNQQWNTGNGFIIASLIVAFFADRWMKSRIKD